MEKATRQQKLFIDEHLKTSKKNATQAAIVAGYSERSASSQASQLLRNPRVVSYLNMRESQIAEELRQQFVFDAQEAYDIMFKIMISDKSRDSDKIEVAKYFLEHSGFIGGEAK